MASLVSVRYTAGVQSKHPWSIRMQISMFSGEPTAAKADLVVYGIYEGRKTGNDAYDNRAKELG